MPFALLLFSLGVIAVSFFPRLPPLWSLYFVFPLLILSWRWRCIRYWFALFCGLAWGIYAGQSLLAMQVDDSLAGKDLIVTGQIQGLPKQNSRLLRFNLRVASIATATGQEIQPENFPAKLQLSWYQFQRNGALRELPQLGIGDHWQLRVRLKRPRGFVNPAGFDYQAWLLRQGIGATGYVVEGRDNEPLKSVVKSFHFDDWINWQRYELQQWVVAHSESSERGILIALLIGDSTLVDKNQWLRMQQTGTSHLIAISGLHVGFLAIFGFYLGLCLGKCVQIIWHRCPALILAWCFAIVSASYYAALAGFNIPTVRTLIMLVVFYVACLWRRSINVVDIFCVALALIVVLDPLAALDMGFWLSFGAVALLLIGFSGRLVAKKTIEPWSGFSAINILTGFIRSQWIMFIGLLLPLSLLVSTVSLVAPIANGIAIPLITFLVVPLLLISAAVRDLLGGTSDFLLQGAGWLMELLKVFLDGLLALGGYWSSPVVAFNPAFAVLIAVSCCVLLLPKGLFPRVLGWGGLLLGAGLNFFIAPPNQPDLALTVLDVGQGTAVVVRVGEHTLVYDTGSKFTDNFDAGSGIVAPYLYAQGIHHVDRLVVSHGDMDHAGGLIGLLEKVSVDQLLAGEPTKIPQAAKNIAEPQNCHQTPAWYWQTVRFEFLPFVQLARASANNRSCVLLISYGEQHILLPGDIETSVENQLLYTQQLPQKLQLLLAAHHGSRTSSGVGFVNKMQPEIVVYSAGYRSQHGHPHPQVRQRYQSIGSREMNTAEAGALVFEWDQHQLQQVYEYRQTQRRYWFD
ncbi:DNA internalization-related competence protein ComEC/Rec2 [Cellvibrio sp. OA-2007]|uniref:DNA internalization-related competence protein ComEC/Rec2 n=1 Tax=Cellvibrio sp. OA-2007 TaxID=529823 RepID=UPI000782F26E|nr:DNA internalization-related competence protein ComEC/Rec2 [Cellvibrio sp. OA-2007]